SPQHHPVYTLSLHDALPISRYGIREGLLLQAARVQPQVADPGEARAKSINELGDRCILDVPHAKQVRSLALQLFDAIGHRIGCRSEEHTSELQSQSNLVCRL